MKNVDNLLFSQTFSDVRNIMAAPLNSSYCSAIFRTVIMSVTLTAQLENDCNHGIPSVRVIGVRCAAPMAHMARTVRTTAVIVLTASVMLLLENACVTRDFMGPSKSQDTSHSPKLLFMPLAALQYTKYKQIS